MQCIQCKKEFKEVRADQKFCSTYCRVKFRRINDTSNMSDTSKNDTSNDTSKVSVPDEKVSVPVENKVSVPVSVPKEIDNIEQPKLSKLTAEELYNGINSYERDLWVDSPEYSELKKRLKTLSIEQLRQQGFSIPCWKLNGLSSPFKT